MMTKILRKKSEILMRFALLSKPGSGNCPALYGKKKDENFNKKFFPAFV